MSASVNKVVLIGNVGKEPEMRYLPNGEATCTLSIATTESWKDKTTGEKKEVTEWSRCVFWRRLAEIVGEYVHKGDSIYVEGSLRTRKWQKEGVDHYQTEIQCSEMKMLGTKGASSGSAKTNNVPASANAPAGAAGNFDDFDNDIPF